MWHFERGCAHLCFIVCHQPAVYLSHHYLFLFSVTGLVTV